MSVTLMLLFFFIVKHFIVDFVYQPPWMWQNKGNLKHLGGYAHAGLHALMTFSAICWLNPMLALFCSVGEFVAHYAIDYSKMNIVKINGWKADKDENFWIMLGLDQMLHYLCYLIIIGVIA